MLAALDNSVIFKRAFTDIEVFTCFIKDILGIEIEVDKIEIEKQFASKIGNIHFVYDIFAESRDHRIIVEIQKVDYDYNFDRFLHYHMMAVAELQKNAKTYKIEQTVFTIVVLTAPYTIEQKTGLPIKDEVLISSVDPRNLKNEMINIYGHKLIFLNPNYKNAETPANYLDWLDLIYESAHHPDNYTLNLDNPGIKKAVGIIDYNALTPEIREKMKIDESRKAMIKIMETKGYNKGKVEGKIEGKIEDILESLEEKGNVPLELKKRIENQQNLEVLKRWFTIACKVESIEEFERQIDG